MYITSQFIPQLQLTRNRYQLAIIEVLHFFVKFPREICTEFVRYFIYVKKSEENNLK